MDSTKRIQDSSNLDELNQLKVWFFKENVRLQILESELKNKEDELLEMKEQFQRETLETKRRLDRERQRLKNDEEFFEKKLDILRNGFAQLDIERTKIKNDRIRLEAERSARISYSRQERSTDMAELLFQGVNSLIALKKRYRELLKIFHPDNTGGDHNMVLTINKLYDEIKSGYEIGKRA